MTRLLLLPGLDGTGRLFDRIAAHLSDDFELTIAAYPQDRSDGYRGLLAQITLPAAPFVVLAESFSGPLAVEIVARTAGVSGVVLVASFASPPRRFPATPTVWLVRQLLRMPPPGLLLRRFLAGDDADPVLVEDLRSAITSVAPVVVAARVGALLTVDVRPKLAALEQTAVVPGGEARPTRARSHRPNDRRRTCSTKARRNRRASFSLADQAPGGGGGHPGVCCRTRLSRPRAYG